MSGRPIRRRVSREALRGAVDAVRTSGRRRARRVEHAVLRRVHRGALRARCEHCGAWLDRGGGCPSCGRSPRIGAAEWIDLIADRGSFRAFGAREQADPLEYVDRVSYVELLRRSRERTGADESVTTGRARIGGHDACLAVFDFGFLGGSIGAAAGERLVEAFTVAAAERLPAVAVVCSSGARLQEGLPALVQMRRTVSAVVELREAGVPFVAVLADPTTGAGYASFASLADVVVAERRALVNFAGPRVVEAVTGESDEPLRAEELEARGLVDQVVRRRDVPRAVTDALAVCDPARRRRAPAVEMRLPAPGPLRGRWRLLEEIRRSDHPTGSWWLTALADRIVVLRGDRGGSDDPALLTVLAEVGGVSLLVLATDRFAATDLVGAAGYRKARRALGVAARLRLPVLTLIDGPGAAVGREADESGLAPALADCLAALLDHPAPSLAVVVGEGSSGGALALAAADRLLMFERATFSVISPEGAAAILQHDASPEALADLLRIGAADAFGLGLVDGVIPDPVGRRLGRRSAVRHVREVVSAELGALSALGPERLRSERRERSLALTRHLLRPIDDPALPPSRPEEDAA